MKCSALLETRDVRGLCRFCLNSDKLDELLGFRGVAEQMLAINQRHLGLCVYKILRKICPNPLKRWQKCASFKVLDCLVLVPNIIQT